MIEGWNQVRSLLPAMWRQRWWGLLGAIVVGIGGAVAVMLIPNRYQATARVYVDTQSILKPLMQGLAVQPNVDQQVAMMARTLVNRPNIERVIRMADMDLQARTPAERDALVDELSRKILLRPAGAVNLYMIQYNDPSAESARRVVQSLLSIFVEANLGDKRRDSEQARRFIDDQIALYEKRLLEAESALKEFKIRNLSVMPNVSGDYVAFAGVAQKELDAARLEMRQLENSREALRRQLADEKPTFTSSEAPELVATPRGPTDTELRLEGGRKRLDELLLRFTDDHPDVINLRRMLADLEGQLEAERKGQRRDSVVRPGTTTVIPNKVYQDIKVQLADVESKLAALRARVADAEQRLREARSAAQTIPKIEAEFTQLTRDYDVTKKNYEQLITRRESAALSVDMESKSGIGEFRVVDPPRVGAQPVSPKRPLLLAGVLAASIAAGLALAFVLTRLKPAFFDGRSLREFAGAPLLGTVTLVRDRAARIRSRLTLATFSIAGLAYLMGFGALIGWVALNPLAS